MPSDRRLLLCLVPLLTALLFVVLFGPIEQAPLELSLALGAAGIAWLVAVRRASQGGLELAVLVAGAIAMRLIVFAHEPGFSDDVYRSVWEGAVVLEGISPYAFAPEAERLVELRLAMPELYAALNNPDISAAYPPCTQAACAGMVALARSLGHEGLSAVPFVRGFFALCDLLVLWPLVVLLRRARLPVGLALVWGWSPLVSIEFAGSGHFDSLGILLLLASLASLPAPNESGRGRRLGACVLLALAILVKYLPLCALPFVVRGQGFVRGAGRALLVVVLCAAGFAPLLALEGGGSGLGGGLSEYGLRWESTSLVYRWIEPAFAQLFERDGSWLDARRLGRLAIGVVWLAWGLLAWRRGRPAVAATGTMIAAFLVLSPTLHPWYLTWVLPFVALRRPGLDRTAWLLLVAAAPLFYLTLVRWRLEEVWEEPVWLWPAIAVPFLLLQGAGSLIVRRA